MDWNEIRNEYITDQSSSYRKLAHKHGVSLTAITKRAKEECWVDQRKQLKDETITKTLEILADKQAERAKKFGALTDKLTDKLTEAFEQVNVKDTKGLRSLAASLKDLKEIGGFKSPSDAREQAARIANLEKQAASDSNTVSGVEVIFMAGPDEWNE